MTVEGSYDIPAESGCFRIGVETGRLTDLVPFLPVGAPDGPVALRVPTAGKGRLDGDLELGVDGPRATIELALQEPVTAGLSGSSARGRFRIDARWVDELDLTVSDRAPRRASSVESRCANSRSHPCQAPWRSPSTPAAGRSTTLGCGAVPGFGRAAGERPVRGPRRAGRRSRGAQWTRRGPTGRRALVRSVPRGAEFELGLGSGGPGGGPAW